MNLATNPDGQYVVSFKTQPGTTGQVLLPTTDEETARRLVAEMRVKELETVSGIVDLQHQVVTQIIAGRNVTLSDAIDMWHAHSVSMKLYSRNTLHVSYVLLKAWAINSGLKDKPITAVSPQHISDYVNKGGERRMTAVRKLTACRQLFSYCLETGITVRNPAGPSMVRVSFSPFSHTEKEPRTRRVFTDQELLDLLTVADSSDDTFWSLAIRIGILTGLRLGDVAQLEWASVTDDSRLVVWTEKSDKRVDLPLTSDILSLMEQLPETDPVYCFPDERQIAIDPTRRAYLSTRFSRLCAKAGIHDRSFHCLRHTNATNLAAQGNALEFIASRLGHRSTTETENYVHTQRTVSPTSTD